jgi:hypothetical protein
MLGISKEESMKEKDFAPSAVLAIVFCGLVLAFGSALLEHQGFLKPSSERMDQAAQKRTVADIRNTGTAMFSWLTDQVGAAAAGQSQVPERMAMDLGDYPEISREDLVTVLIPTYLEKLPELDGWGNPYEFYLNTANPLAEKVMGMRSPGRDGVFAGSVYEVDGFDPNDFDQDIVWFDGFFARWPQMPKS